MFWRGLDIIPRCEACLQHSLFAFSEFLLCQKHRRGEDKLKKQKIPPTRMWVNHTGQSIMSKLFQICLAFNTRSSHVLKPRCCITILFCYKMNFEHWWFKAGDTSKLDVLCLISCIVMNLSRLHQINKLP